MLYLFNSSFRPIYTKNLLNIIAFPEGYYVTLRYTISGEHVNLDKSKEKEYLKLKKGTETLIVFVNRYGDQMYEYTPVRKGHLNKVYKTGNQLFFVVKLMGYWFPIEIQKFNTSLVDTLVTLPKFKDFPENNNDGHYAIVNKDLTQEYTKIADKELEWIDITNRINQGEVFKETAGKTVLMCKFYISYRRLRLINWKEKKLFNIDEKLLVPRSNKNIIRLNRAKEYKVNLYYRYFGISRDSNAELYLNADEGIWFENSNSTISAGSNDGRLISLLIDKYKVSSRGRFEIDFILKDETIMSIYKPEIELNYKIIKSFFFKLLVLSGLLLFVCSDIISDLEFSENEVINLKLILMKLGTIPLIASILKGIILFVFYKELKKD